MKKMTSVLQTIFMKQGLLAFLVLLTITCSYAQKTSTGSGDWGTAGTWTPAGVPAATDNVIIAAGHNVRVNVTANCANMTINATGTLRLDNNSISVNGNWTNNGTFQVSCQCPNNTVIMTGTGGTMGGSSLTTFFNLTINTSTNTNVVSLLNSNFKIDNSGLLMLQNGILKLGTNSLTMSDGQSTTITRVNGNFAHAADGTGLHTDADGGTIRAASSSGASISVNGNPTFYNILSTADANWQLQLNNNATRINGTLTAVGASSWGFRTSSNAPIWGPSSTYYLDRANQGLAWTNSDLSWVAMASGTIGVTPGYPNNVIFTNLGSSQTPDGCGLGLTGNVAINGKFTVGDNITNGRISMAGITSFTSGGIQVNNNSLLIGPPTAATFIDKGDFILAGATTGVFQSSGATINFAGTGTTAAPQYISTTGSSITFTNMTVSNGTYVRLQDPVNITGVLNMASGYVGTTTTNILTVNNPATTAVTGGSTTAYVDGPLAWTIPATTTATYVFPIGDKQNNGGEYLPLSMSPNTTSGATVTATAFNLNSGGTPGASVTSISTGEYWSVTTSSPFTSGPLVTVSRQTAVSPNNAMAVSTTTSNGVYNAVGGTPSGNSMVGGGIGTLSPTYIVIVVAPLSVVRLSGKNYGCSGSVGSLVVGGSGGTAPYMYSVDGGAFQASGTFDPLSAGDHSVTVRDATMATSTSTLKVLGSVVINGNNADVLTCPGDATTLTASNLQNTTPTYSWSPGGQTTAAITVSPTVNTTYTVTSTLYNNNLITNGSFESGSTATGFTSGYTNYVGAQYATTPGAGGLYTISNAGTNQCQYFTILAGGVGPSLTPQNGGAYFIGDGFTASSMVLSQTITGLTIGTVYKFQYYYAAGNPDATRAVLRTTVTGGTLGFVAPTASADITTTNASAWSQATYTITATATSVSITLTNMTATGSTNGNDFFLDNMELLSPCTVTSSINVITSCPLPVELLDFNAEKQGAGALLTWKTVYEQNNSHFVVEKSADGISFSAIGTRAGAGNSTSLIAYSFTDPFIASGVTYYRLAQYDADGSVHYSEVKAVSKGGIIGIQVIPNPNNGVFVITFDNTSALNVQASVLNSLGQVVHACATSATNVQNVDISSLPAGIYYLQVNTNEETIVQKIIKE